MGEVIGDHQRQIEENLLAFPRSNPVLIPILGKICLVPIKPFYTRQSRHLMPYFVYDNHIRDDAEMSITHWQVAQEGVTAWDRIINQTFYLGLTGRADSFAPIGSCQLG